MLVSMIEGARKASGFSVKLVRSYGDIDVSQLQRVYEKDSSVHICRYVPNGVYDALGEFLSIIRSFIRAQGGMVYDEFFSTCGVYPLNRDMFSEYFSTGVLSDRLEPVIYSEAGYVRGQVIKDICSMLSYVAEQSGAGLVILILGIECAPAAVTHLLLNIEKFSQGGSLSVICVQNTATGINLTKSFARFLEGVHDVIDLCDAGSWAGRDEDECFLDRDFVRCVTNSFYETAYENVIGIYENCWRVLLNEDENCRLLGYVAMSYSYRSQHEKAWEVSARLVDYAISKASKESRYNALIVTVRCMINSGRKGDARKFLSAAVALSKKIGVADSEFVCRLLECMIQYNNWIDPVPFSAGNYDTLVSMCLARKYINHAAYVAIFSSDSELLCRAGGGSMFRSGVELAKQSANRYLLGNAYRMASSRARADGRDDIAEEFIQQRIEAVTDDMSADSAAFYVAKTCREIGCELQRLEDYGEARKFLVRAYGGFCERKDVPNACALLYELSVNASLCGDFNAAFLYLSRLLNVMDRCCMCEVSGGISLSRILSVKAYVDFCCGMMFECSVGVMRVIATDGELFKDGLIEDASAKLWHGIVTALDAICKKLSVGVGLMALNDVRQYVSVCDDPFLVSAFYRVYSELCANGGAALPSIRMLCINACFDGGYVKAAKSIRDGVSVCASAADGTFRGESFGLLDNAVRNYQAVLSFERENALRVFFSDFQRGLLGRGSMEDILSFLAESVGAFFGFTDVLLYRKDGAELLRSVCRTDKGSGECYLASISVQSAKVAFRDCFDFGVFATRMDSDYRRFYRLYKRFGIAGEDKDAVAVIPLYNGGEISSVLVAAADITPDAKKCGMIKRLSSVPVLREVVSCAVDAAVRAEAEERIRRLNEELSEANRRLGVLASSDNLTGLLNRNGLRSLIADMKDRAIEDVCVWYVDCDNFKGYNDTFGHDVGDIVLKVFAETLDEFVKELPNGAAVRMGGDEFLLIFECLGISEGELKDMAEKLIFNISHSSVFEERILAETGKAVTMPDDKKIGCSIGVVVSKADCGVTEQVYVSLVDSIVTAADNMMYEIKHTTKGACKIKKIESFAKEALCG